MAAEANQASVLGIDSGVGANVQLALQGVMHHDSVSPSWIGEPTHLPVRAIGARPLGGMAKRSLDMIVAISVLVVSAPLLLCLIAAIRLTSGGSALFAHDRVGFGGRIFRCYKLRTMVPNASEVLKAYLAANPDAEREWSSSQKLQHDPRVTRLGLILRRTSLDELPQLINVLRGEMSCVGPRPIVLPELERYGPYAADYLSARPGMTGAWQIGGRSRVDYAQRVLMDAGYVRSWSFWGDLVILLKTIPVAATLDGSC